MKAFKNAVLIGMAASLLMLLTPACNTLRGVGKDVERTGEKIQDVAT